MAVIGGLNHLLCRKPWTTTRDAKALPDAKNRRLTRDTVIRTTRNFATHRRRFARLGVSLDRRILAGNFAQRQGFFAVPRPVIELAGRRAF